MKNKPLNLLKKHALKQFSHLPILISILATSLNTLNLHAEENDPYIWLEEVESERALNWVRSQNEKTFDTLTKDPAFESRKAEALEILNASDKIVYASLRGDYAYNFWRDKNHIQGIWRRTKTEDYLNGDYEWEILIDLDKMSAADGETWVWKGVDFQNPNKSRALVSLSRGGKDAVEIREYDVKSKAFIKEGFFVPEAKCDATWLNEDEILLSTDWGEDSMTESGYARTVKRLKRGKAVNEAKYVHTVAKSSVSIASYDLNFAGKTYTLIEDGVSFFESLKYLYISDNDLLELPLPLTSTIEALYKNQLIVELKEEWTFKNQNYEPGTVISFNIDQFKKKRDIANLSVLYTPTKGSAYQSMKVTPTALLVKSINHVSSVLTKSDFDGSKWTSEKLNLPENGVIDVTFSNSESPITFISYSNFLIPNTLFALNTENWELTKLQSLPERFKSEDLEVHQQFTTSNDGTSIPYFIVHKKGIVKNGKNPTYLYGYGGFNVTMNPFYLNNYGKLWVEKGGVFVLANIRGGGEYGPSWHQAALKENRQRAYDDFHSIAEDLIQKKITSPKHLGIGGGSNGGLLVGVAFTQRPDLYNAVFCAVPLLDMMRYHLLLAGASWIGEYGDPRIPEERAYIEQYSPYQNLSEEKKYPEVFFYTSTKDDRVHPAHARKMAARMDEMDHPFYYFERIEGGHAGGSNLAQYAELYALQFTYLHLKLK